ncbi:hypothetical protein [Micromonospora sp. DT81.3]|uniref:hypothetical protein n=1 Tax=Micromonospora sp. DT81.3 TaxID=3416523 RepID=UPI003CFAF382
MSDSSEASPERNSETEDDREADPLHVQLGDINLSRDVAEADYDLGEISVAGTAPTSEPYNPQRHRESARGRIAATLMVLLFALCISMVALGFILIRPVDRELLGLLISGVLGPVIAIVGTVVGFYFGQDSIAQKSE